MSKPKKNDRLLIPKVIERLKSFTPLYRGLYRKSATGKASPRMAIKTQCLECVGGLRDEITNCTDLGCPLYLYRPYQPLK